MPSKRKSNKRVPDKELATIQELTAHLKIQQWDALIIGDGSGSRWDSGMGWGSVLIDNYSAARKLFYGAANIGTVTLAELMPYIYAMSWYAGPKGMGHVCRKHKAQQGLNVQVHIVTDSRVIATCGARPESRKAYRELWAMLDCYRANGFDLTFHHVSRDVVNMNVLMDAISRQSRLSLAGVYERAIQELQGKYPGLPDEASIYDFST